MNNLLNATDPTRWMSSNTSRSWGEGVDELTNYEWAAATSTNQGARNMYEYSQNGNVSATYAKAIGHLYSHSYSFNYNSPSKGHFVNIKRKETKLYAYFWHKSTLYLFWNTEETNEGLM